MPPHTGAIAAKMVPNLESLAAHGSDKAAKVLERRGGLRGDVREDRNMAQPFHGLERSSRTQATFSSGVSACVTASSQDLQLVMRPTHRDSRFQFPLD